MRRCDKFRMRNELAMSLCRDRDIGPNDTRATRMALHVRFATIARHVLAAIALRLGHVFAWQKTDKLWNQDQKDQERYCEHTHISQYTRGSRSFLPGPTQI